VNRDIRNITGIFIIIGIAVILVCGLLSVLLANSILVPLKRITRTAEKMASGDYKAKCDKTNDDEIGKLSDTLNHMAEEIVKKEQLKNEFISSISHELRTPLTSIKGWAITLKGGSYEDREMMEDGLDIIEKECDRLTGMVEELLDFSKFLSGKETIKKEEVFIEEILEYVRIQVTPRAVRDNVKFSLNNQGAPTSIIADANRLKQIFINILDNAFRFTPPGGTVDFSTGQEGDYILFRIKDSGCGISPDELPKVKEKFYKGKNSKSRNGIGLSICDELVRLMGGTLEIESEVGTGTEVLVKLPIKGGG
jgi:signal transduction histidine kinase